MSNIFGPVGVEPAIWEGVHDATVLHFTGRARSHREKLFHRAKDICERVMQQSRQLTVLIDGSFVTEKELPNDIDLWIFAEVQDEVYSRNLLDPAWLNWLHDTSKRVDRVDIYVFPTFDGMIIDNWTLRAYSTTSVDWYVAQLGSWFASGRKNEPPKGAYLLQI